MEINTNQITGKENKIMNSSEKTQNQTRNFLISAKELDNLPKSPWLIKDIFPKCGVAMVYGQPGVGKTFSMLDIAGCIATGSNWHGYKTIKGPVVIIEMEGKYSVSERCKAWINGNGQSSDIFNENVWFVFESCQFNKEDDVNKLIQKIEEQISKSPALIVIDTLARCNVGGEENSSKDMGVFMALCTHVSQHFETMVLIIHHSQKAVGTSKENSYRGSTAIGGALDTMVYLKKTNDVITFECTKQKDNEPFKPLKFKLKNDPLSQMAYISLISGTSASRVREEADDKEEADLDKNCRCIIEFLKREGKMRYGELLKQTEIPNTTLNNKLHYLRGCGIVRKDGVYYVLTNKDT